MKNFFVGSVLSLISTAWLLMLTFVALTNPVSSWGRSGRFVATLKENGTFLLFIFLLALFILSIAILCNEYFKKEM